MSSDSYFSLNFIRTPFLLPQPPPPTEAAQTLIELSEIQPPIILPPAIQIIQPPRIQQTRIVIDLTGADTETPSVEVAKDKKKVKEKPEKTISKTDQISKQRFRDVVVQIDDLKSFLFISSMNVNVFKRKHPKISQLSQFEYYYTVQQLEEFIKRHEGRSALSNEAIVELIALLAQRWERIQNKNTAYTQDTTHPANILCIQIAQEISKGSGMSVFEILMPTITNKENNITLTELSDEQLKITHFILSDDNQFFIEVNQSLEYYSQYGEFRLGHADRDGISRLLSEEEIGRVINHTIETKAFYDRAQQLLKAKGNPNTLGFALAQLGLALRQGSIGEEGEEFRAGPNAEVAIYNFDEIINSLDEHIKTKFLGLQCTTSKGAIIFSELWERLAREKNIRSTNAELCVLNISGIIFDLLNQHPNLYNINYHSSRPSSSHFSEIQQYHARALDKLKKPNPNIVSHTYPEENDQEMTRHILRQQDHFWTIFENNKIKFYQFFSNLDAKNKHIAVRRLLQNQNGIKFLVQQTKDFKSLTILLKSISEPLRLTVLQSSDLLNQLYDKAKLPKAKNEYLKNLLDLLGLTKHKRKWLECLRRDILQEHQLNSEIAKILGTEEDSMISDTESFDRPVAVFEEEAELARDVMTSEPETGEPRIQLSLLLTQEELLQFVHAHDEEPALVERNESAMDLDEEPIVPIIPISVRRKRKISELESEYVSDSPLPKPAFQPFFQGLADFPAVDTAEIELSPEDAALFEEEAPPTKRARYDSEFIDRKNTEKKNDDCNIYVELFSKAQDCVEWDRSLEAIHYLERAYVYIKKKGLGRPFSEGGNRGRYEWLLTENKRLIKIANEAIIKLIRLSPRMMDRYRSKSDALVTNWCKTTVFVIKRLLKRELSQEENNAISTILLLERAD